MAASYAVLYGDSYSRKHFCLIKRSKKKIYFEIKIIDLFLDDRYHNRINIFLCVMNSHNIVFDACSKVV